MMMWLIDRLRFWVVMRVYVLLMRLRRWCILGWMRVIDNWTLGAIRVHDPEFLDSVRSRHCPHHELVGIGIVKASSPPYSIGQGGLKAVQNIKGSNEHSPTEFQGA